MSTPGVTLALIGAGLRGQTFARHAVATGAARVVAIAEPDPVRRAAAAAEFGVPDDRLFAGWAELVAAPRLADAAIVATQDRMHHDPAVRLAALGYHLLLEKPVAPAEPEAAAIADAARANGVMLAVCHVLRYTPYTRMLKRLLAEDRIERLISVQHLEPVGWWHHAHSFVRGNWRRADESGPMLLTKSCHDISPRSPIPTSKESLATHRVVWAAEQARVRGQVVSLSAGRHRHGVTGARLRSASRSSSTCRFHSRLPACQPSSSWPVRQ